MTIAAIYYYVVLANFDIALGLLYVRSSPGRYREPLLDRLIELCHHDEMTVMLRGAVSDLNSTRTTTVPVSDLHLVMSWMGKLPMDKLGTIGDITHELSIMDVAIHWIYDFFASNLDVLAVFVFSVVIPVTMFWLHMLLYTKPPFPLDHEVILLILGLGQLLPLLFHMIGSSLKFLVGWRFKRSLDRLILWQNRHTNENQVD